MRTHLREKLEASDLRPKCDCGWLRPKFTEIRQGDGTPVRLNDFYLIFDCPQCGARWDAHYGKLS